jgi:glycosyltransferase involved in cell wall biosynthesis
MKLSVVLATRNEEENIAECLESIHQLADEIVIVDERSTDNTCKIAKQYGAKIYQAKHEPIFHITKQKAINKATGDWVLYRKETKRKKEMEIIC